jgi:hypothetical protein
MGMKGGAIYLIDKSQPPKLALASSSDTSLFASQLPIYASEGLTVTSDGRIPDSSKEGDAISRLLRT